MKENKYVVLVSKGGWIHLADFSAIFTSETTFVTFCLLFWTPTPFKKGSTLKQQNLLPNGQILSF